MKIELHPAFKKSYKKRIVKNRTLVTQVEKRLRAFQENSQNPILKDHSLVGSKHRLRAFSVTGDMRIVYMKVSKNHILLLDIGTHNQVY